MMWVATCSDGSTFAIRIDDGQTRSLRILIKLNNDWLATPFDWEYARKDPLWAAKLAFEYYRRDNDTPQVATVKPYDRAYSGG